MECKICRGTGSMQAQHPFDGEPVLVDCPCTDDYQYDEVLWPPPISRSSAERWYNMGYFDHNEDLDLEGHRFEERWSENT